MTPDFDRIADSRRWRRLGTHFRPLLATRRDLAPAGLETRRRLAKWAAISPLIGLVAGVGAIVFYSAIRIAAAGLLGGGAGYRPPLPAGEGVTVTMPINHPWLVILVLVLGGLLSGLLVFLLAPEAEGHGTDAAIAAFHRGTPVRAGSPLVGKTLRDLQLPGGSLVVAVQRGRDTLIPHGNTRLQAGDVLTLAVQRDFEAEVRRVLAATAGT